MRTLIAAAVAVCSCVAMGAEMPSRDELLRQLQASDVLSRAIDKQTDAVTGPDGSPVLPIPYDRLLRQTMSLLPSPSPASIDELNEYQIRSAIAMLHRQNLERYVALARRGIGITPEQIRQEAGSAEQSSQLKGYLDASSQPTPMRPSAAAALSDNSEAGRTGKRSPDQVTIAALSGNAAGRAFGVASTEAPLGARRPGSEMFAASDPRTLAMAADAPGTARLRAIPPGNPPEVTPSPEEISRVAAALNVGFETAEKVITGGMSLAEVRKTTVVPREQAELMGGLMVNDPRWSSFYYGPNRAFSEWVVDSREAFDFHSGGGRYERSDRRVNHDFDMRTRGDIDRRVNSNNDRRLDTRNDVRSNY